MALRCILTVAAFHYCQSKLFLGSTMPPSVATVSMLSTLAVHVVQKRDKYWVVRCNEKIFDPGRSVCHTLMLTMIHK